MIWKRNAISDELADWVISRYEWLINELGTKNFFEDTKLILPTSSFFKTGYGRDEAVIPPFLMGLSRRIHAAVLSFIAGVMPPMPMLGRSLLCLLDGFKDILAQPFAANRSIVPLYISILLGFTWLDMFKANALFLSPFRPLADRRCLHR